MKRLIQLVTFLFILYFAAQVLLVFIGNGHTINYQIIDGDNNFSVHEEYRSNNKIDSNNYFLNITINNTEFNILTYENFKRSSKIVDNIKYYEDDQYKCIYVLYRNNKVLTDVICDNGPYKIAYHSINNPSDGLRSFIRDLMAENGYSENNWIDDVFTVEEANLATLYTGNVVNNHFVGLVVNNILYRFNNIEKIANSNLPESQIPRVQAFTDKKFIYLDNALKTINVYSITSSENYIVGYTMDLNDSIVLGSYRNSMFVFDRNTQVEYEANVESKTFLEIGNSDTVIKYYANGKWQHEPLANIDINNLNFGSLYPNDYNDDEFDKTIKIGNKYGYYYYYKNAGREYQIYRSDIDHKDNKTYLFSTTNIDSIQFIDGYIYYIEGNYLKYYSDNKGNRTLVKINDMNNNSLYRVYIDKTKEA